MHELHTMCDFGWLERATFLMGSNRRAFINLLHTERCDVNTEVIYFKYIYI